MKPMTTVLTLGLLIPGSAHAALGLAVSELARGTQVSLTATGAAPGSQVGFAYSRVGEAPSALCPPAFGGLCLDLIPPVHTLGTATADGTGQAVFVATLNASAPLITVYLQAVTLAGPDKSAAVVATVCDPTAYYADLDGDGVGDGAVVLTCAGPPPGHVLLDGDCDDSDPGVFPGATEVVDGVDNNCNGWVDLDASMPTPVPGWTVEVYAGPVHAPMAVAFDSAGRLYIGRDEVTDQIHRAPAGGGAVSAFGPPLQDPDSVAVAADDTIYIGSEGGLYAVDTAGAGGLHTATLMGNNTSIAVDLDGVLTTPGNLFVSNARDPGGADIVEVTPAGGASVFATDASLFVPFGMALNPTDLYVVEREPGLEGIYRIGSDGLVHDFVTSGLVTPHGIAYSAFDGLFYVGDIGQDALLTVTAAGVLDVFATGLVVQGLTFDAAGSLYVSDRSVVPGRILRFSPAG